AGHVPGHLDRATIPSLVEAPNIELRVGVLRRGGVPAHALHRAAVHHVEVAGVLELVGGALEDDDVPRLDAGALEPRDDGQHDLGTGDAAGGVVDAPAFVGRRLAADRVDLDADDVAFAEEALP